MCAGQFLELALAGQIESRHALLYLGVLECGLQTQHSQTKRRQSAPIAATPDKIVIQMRALAVLSFSISWADAASLACSNSECPVFSWSCSSAASGVSAGKVSQSSRMRCLTEQKENPLWRLGAHSPLVFVMLSIAASCLVFDSSASAFDCCSSTRKPSSAVSCTPDRVRKKDELLQDGLCKCETNWQLTNATFFWTSFISSCVRVSCCWPCSRPNALAK